MVCYRSVSLQVFNLYFSLLFSGIPRITGSQPMAEHTVHFRTTGIHPMKPPV